MRSHGSKEDPVGFEDLSCPTTHRLTAYMAVGQNRGYHFAPPFFSMLVGIEMFTGGTGF